MDEIARIRRLADFLCSGHAFCEARFGFWATALDLATLACSAWIAALVFAADATSREITPFGLDPKVWLGTLAVFAFFLSILPFLLKWREKAEAHRRAATAFAIVKRLSEASRAQYHDGDAVTESALFHRYHAAAESSVAIPESLFLAAKKHHLTKIFLSRYLDNHPSANVLILRLRMFFRDSFGAFERPARF